MSIPKKLQPHIQAAFPTHFLTMGTVLPDGFAQISPRGTTQVYDDDHLSVWERGIGKSQEQIVDGTKLTFFYANLELGAQGMSFVRLYGRAERHPSGPVYDKVWNSIPELERKQDPEKKGYAVLVKIERVEDLRGNPITD